MNSLSLSADTSPFHKGEKIVQSKAGEVESGNRNGTVISNQIIPGAIPFIAQQSMIVVSHIDPTGNVWASVLFGKPGFIKAINRSLIELDSSIIVSHTDDSFWGNIDINPTIGLLIIELSTRRRLRINGKIEKIDNYRYQIMVEQTYPNCPKYIQRRNLSLDTDNNRSLLPKVESGNQLKPDQAQLIANADSFFVASACQLLESNASATDFSSPFTADASHRGGFPGFVEVKGNRLRIPDYPGNSMFNTLGNIEMYPHAGLVFIDFDNSKLIQVSGSAKILWDEEDLTNQSDGTQRFWELYIERWQETPIPASISWQFFDYSPHNPRSNKAESNNTETLTLQVSKVVEETKAIKTFTLVSNDHGILPAIEAGSHLPIVLTLPSGKQIERHYSIISSSDENRFYKIAVQKQSRSRGGSEFIHNQLVAGSLLSAKAPKNAFPLGNHSGCTLLVAGGIGITPILSMIQTLKSRNRPFEVHYVAKTQQDMAFYEKVKKIAQGRAYFYFSKEPSSPKLDVVALMKSATENTHLYVCGPTKLINAIRDTGNILDWNPEKIHFESFGTNNKDNKTFQVNLTKTNAVITVKPQESILDVLIKKKINVAYDCKRGECGMCAVDIIKGDVEHRDFYLSKSEQNAQMCICVSRAKDSKLVLAI
ncbi:pyridoxamine 5'-phosphate oxidase family protein [Aliikangiella marina]|nr:pyridoxamine 5'-phosphate oxidase family protein [Aliikangiella marina]